MTHAEASDFGEGLTKQEVYEQVLLQAEGLFNGQRNWVCNLSNSASLLWHAYKALATPSNKVNWAGFYTVSTSDANQLILGPFQGKVACQTIAIGRGVCGVAAKQRKPMLVSDVDSFPDHIACDGDSRSEIVVPVIVGNATLVAIIDVDCAVLHGFDTVDQEYLEKLASLIAKSCDWPQT